MLTPPAGGKNTNKGKTNYSKAQRDTKKRKERRNKSSEKLARCRTNEEGKRIKNLSNKDLTGAQIKLISKGLKFIQIKDFCRRVRLQDLFANQPQDSDFNPRLYLSTGWKKAFKQISVYTLRVVSPL